ncbi:MAG: formate dehydrogenase accessory protein FdhE [Acidobacteriia bacterium]|nr:formate dehydrogenase accessory protein FdhE [Terriglobia bacterium]
MKKFSWDARLRRAAQLAAAYPFAAEILCFYQPLARFQKDLDARLRASCGPAAISPEAAALRQPLDLSLLLPQFPLFLALIESVAPAPLAQLARELLLEGSAPWVRLLSAYWDGDRHGENLAENPRFFFARAFLQPYAEFLAEHAASPAPGSAPRFCPICGGLPQCGVLRQEGDGAKRSLLCSVCATEWDFRRIVCPACGEENVDHLAVYTAAEFKHLRLEACDTCRIFITTVDLTKDGFAVPQVDELAAIPLSLWAQENSYVKLQPNLLGT